MDLDKVKRAFQRNRYSVHCFATAAEAAAYLDREIDGCTVGIGDSETLRDLGIFQKLRTHNEVYDPHNLQEGQDFTDMSKKCLTSDIFLTSVNGATETGLMVNMDGLGNRVSASLYGHKKVYFVFGVNKIETDLEKAIWRVRNVAAPKNAERHHLKTTGCAHQNWERCCDCGSPERICNALVIYYKKMMRTEAEVIIINEELGY